MCFLRCLRTELASQIADILQKLKIDIFIWIFTKSSGLQDRLKLFELPNLLFDFCEVVIGMLFDLTSVIFAKFGLQTGMGKTLFG